MSFQAAASIIESCLYKGVEYGVLLSIANYANKDGYAAVGYDTIAEEARSKKRHVIRVIEGLNAKAEAALQAGTEDWALRKLSVGGGAYGTNEYQLNLAHFELAQQRVRQARRDRRKNRRTVPGAGVAGAAEKGVTSGHPPAAIRGDNAGRQGDSGVTHNGDSRSHPIPSLLFFDPTREREPGEGSRSARDLDPVDWVAVRQAMKEAYGQELFAAEISRLKCQGQLVVAPNVHYRDWVFAQYGPWLRNKGLVAISSEDDAREFKL